MARPAFMPNLKKTEAAAPAAPVAEAAPVAAPVAEAAPVAAPPIVETVEAAPVVETPVAEAAAPAEKKAVDRKKPNRAMTPEDTQFIVGNVKTMSYTEIAEARGITKHQVNRVLMQVKKQLKEAAGDNAEALAAVNKHIDDHLSRPEDTRPGGGGGRAGVVKASIDDIVGNILNSIG